MPGNESNLWIRSHQETLERRISEVEGELRSSDEGTVAGLTADELATLVTDFRSDVEDHFRAEEDRQFLTDIIRDVPELQDEVDLLQQEHHAIRSALRFIEERCTAAEAPDEPAQLRLRLLNVLRRLRQHEVAEDEILRATGDT